MISVHEVKDDLSVDENSSQYTNLDEALMFVKETNVDALAVAIGTTHG